MRKFNDFYKEKMTEGLFSGWGKKKPKDDPLDADIHTDRTPTGLKSGEDSRATTDDINTTTARMGSNSLFHALRDFVTIHGNQYSPEEIRLFSGDNTTGEKFNQMWNTKYKTIYASTRNQPGTQQFVLRRAFSEMGIPPPRPPMAIPVLPQKPEPQPPAPPELKAIADYARKRLADDKTLTADALKKEIISKNPGLVKKYGKWVYAQVGRVVNMATKPSIVKSVPVEPEPEPDRNVLKFPGVQ